MLSLRTLGQNLLLNGTVKDKTQFDLSDRVYKLLIFMEGAIPDSLVDC